MKKTGWIIGITSEVLVALFLLLLILSAGAEAKAGSPKLSGEEATALTRRACELYCAGIFYTEKALQTDPSTTSYEEWQNSVRNADAYWNALESVTERLKNGIDTETFDAMFSQQRGKKSAAFVNVAYAYEASEVLQIFDSAPAGKRLQTLANFLGQDMQYAKAALKMANGQITAEEWTKFGDTAQKLEAAARTARSMGKVAATTAGLLATGGASGVLEVGLLTVSGADLAMQIGDDAAFVALGDSYDGNEYVAALNKTKDLWSKAAAPAEIIFCDVSDVTGMGLFMLSTADNIRSMLQEGKLLGYDVTGAKHGQGAAAVKTTWEEMAEQLKAAEQGGSALADIQPMLTVIKTHYQGDYGSLYQTLTGEALPQAPQGKEGSAVAQTSHLGIENNIEEIETDTVLEADAANLAAGTYVYEAYTCRYVMELSSDGSYKNTCYVIETGEIEVEKIGTYTLTASEDLDKAYFMDVDFQYYDYDADGNLMFDGLFYYEDYIIFNEGVQNGQIVSIEGYVRQTED